VFALVGVLLGLYVGGYLWLGEFRQSPIVFGAGIERAYSQQWMAIVFQPAAKLEGRMRGIEVQAFETHPSVPLDDPFRP
jgi:hypothetical protein